MVTVCVSDVHLGYRHCRREAFLRFLEALAGWREVGRLVLLGDIMDMWRRDMAGVVLESAPVLSRLVALSSRIRVYYVAGNHDYHLGGLRNFNYPFSFSRKLTLREGGVVYRFSHGYEFDPSLPHWCGTIVIAREWHVPPWEVDGIPLTPWRRMVWRYRMELYLAELNAKLERERTQVNQHFTE